MATADLNKGISWFYSKKGRASYSMANRFGPSSYDCSSAVTMALRKSGFKVGWQTTMSLPATLRRLKWKRVARSNVQRGDIFLWNGGAGGGHTGMFVNTNSVIHMNYGANGITKDTMASVGAFAGRLGIEYWSYTGRGSSGGVPLPPTKPPPIPDGQESETKLYIGGELFDLYLKDKKIYVRGWKYNSEYQNTNITIKLVDVFTEKIVDTLDLKPQKLASLKEEHPDSPNIENSYYNSFFSKVPNNSSYYIKVSRGGDDEEISFLEDIIRVYYLDMVEVIEKTSKRFYYEILNNSGKVILREDELLNNISIHNEINDIPTTELIVPIKVYNSIVFYNDIKIYIDDKVFYGIIVGHELDKENETITLTVNHILHIFNFEYTPINIACKNRKLSDIMTTSDFVVRNFYVDFFFNQTYRYLDTITGEITNKKVRETYRKDVFNVDYVYSKQTKYEALNETIGMLPYVNYRVNLTRGKVLEIGVFGERKLFQIDKYNLIEEPTIRIANYGELFNVATVYSDKNDGGMGTLTLRESYSEKTSQRKKFPIYIVKDDANNERYYRYTNNPKIGSNVNIEYSVIDEENVGLLNGRLIEKSFLFNDIAPFEEEDLIDKAEFKKSGEKKITDVSRVKASNVCYERVIKKLHEGRPRLEIDVSIIDLPNDVNVGDEIKFIYDNRIWEQFECHKMMHKIYSQNEWWQIKSIDYNYGGDNATSIDITLVKEIV